MLFYLLSIISLIYSVSSDISCYDCSSIQDEYPYIITADNIPTAFQNCKLEVNHTRCSIKVRWYISFNKTDINIFPDDTNFPSSEHTLQADIVMSGFGLTQVMQHSLYYFCSTDRCNNANQFKRLLESIAISNDFPDLEDLITPTLPFDGKWCLRDGNQTDKDCPSPTSIDPSTCKQCSTNFTAEPTTNKFCASCFTDNVHDESISREVLYNLNDRKNSDSWTIHCRSPNCNELRTGQRINEKSIITFDFNNFLNNNGSKQSSIKISLIIMIFIIKTFF